MYYYRGFFFNTEDKVWGRREFVCHQPKKMYSKSYHISKKDAQCSETDFSFTSFFVRYLVFEIWLILHAVDFDVFDLMHKNRPYLKN